LGIEPKSIKMPVIQLISFPRDPLIESTTVNIQTDQIDSLLIDLKANKFKYRHLFIVMEVSLPRTVATLSIAQMQALSRLGCQIVCQMRGAAESANGRLLDVLANTDHLVLSDIHNQSTYLNYVEKNAPGLKTLQQRVKNAIVFSTSPTRASKHRKLDLATLLLETQKPEPTLDQEQANNLLATLPRRYRNQRAFATTKGLHGIDIYKASQQSMAKLLRDLQSDFGLNEDEQQVRDGLGLTKAERRVFNLVLTIDLTLKHKTYYLASIKNNGNAVKSIRQRFRETNQLPLSHTGAIGTFKDDYVFASIGSKAHSGAEFLQAPRTVVITASLQGLKENQQKKSLDALGMWMGSHWGYPDRRLYVNRFDDCIRSVQQQQSITTSNQQEQTVFQYISASDGTIRHERSETKAEQTVFGDSIPQFIGLYLIRELRYLGVSYRSSMLQNPVLAQIEAAVDAIFHTHFFEVTVPSQLLLNNPAISIEKKPDNPLDTKQRRLAIAEAIKAGDDRALLTLLDEGLSVDVGLPGFETPMGLALKVNNSQAVEILLSRGADLRTIFCELPGKLDELCKQKSEKIIGLLLNHPLLDFRDSRVQSFIDLNKFAKDAGYPLPVLKLLDKNGFPLKFFASKVLLALLSNKMVDHEKFSAASLCLNYSPILDSNNEQHALGKYIAYCIENNQLNWVRLLLPLLSNLNALLSFNEKNGDLFRVSLLHFAVRVGQLDMVQLLVKAGANPDVHDDKGNSALDLARLGNLHEIVSYLKSLTNTNQPTSISTPIKASKTTLTIVTALNKAGELCVLLSRPRIHNNQLEHYQLPTYKGFTLNDCTPLDGAKQAVADSCGVVLEDRLVASTTAIYSTPQCNIFHVKLARSKEQTALFFTNGWAKPAWHTLADVLDGAATIHPFTKQVLQAVNESTDCLAQWVPSYLSAIDGLFAAVRAGNIPEVARLVKAGSDVNFCHERYGTPLIYACDQTCINLPMVTALLQMGAHPGKTHTYDNKEPYSPLRIAVFKGHHELIAVLIRGGAALNQIFGTNLLTVVHTAIEALDLSTIVFLQQQGLDLKAECHAGALAYACYLRCSDEMFEYLIDKGDNNAVPKVTLYHTALMLESLLGNTVRVNRLLAAKVDAEIIHPYRGKTALELVPEDHSELEGSLYDYTMSCEALAGSERGKIDFYFSLTETAGLSREQKLYEEYRLTLISPQTLPLTAQLVSSIARQVAPEGFAVDVDFVIIERSLDLVGVLPLLKKPTIAITKALLTDRSYAANGVSILRAGIALALANLAIEHQNLIIPPPIPAQYERDIGVMKTLGSAQALINFLQLSDAHKSTNSECDCGNYCYKNCDSWLIGVPYAVQRKFRVSNIPLEFGTRIKALQTYLASQDLIADDPQEYAVELAVSQEVSRINHRFYYFPQFLILGTTLAKINYLEAQLESLAIEVLPYESTGYASTRAQEFCNLLHSIDYDEDSEEERQAVEQLLAKAIALKLSVVSLIYEAIYKVFSTPVYGPFRELFALVQQFIDSNNNQEIIATAKKINSIVRENLHHFDYLNDKLKGNSYDITRHSSFELTNKGNNAATHPQRTFVTNIGSLLQFPSFKPTATRPTPWDRQIAAMNQDNEHEIYRTLCLMGIICYMPMWQRLPDKYLLESLKLNSKIEFGRSLYVLASPKQIPKEVSYHTDLEGFRKAISNELASRTTFNRNHFATYNNFEEAFIAFYDAQYYGLQFNRTEHNNPQAGGYLLAVFAEKVEQGDAQAVQVIKGFFLGRTDKRDLNHLFKASTQFPMLDRTHPFYTFVLLQTYKGKRFNLFSVEEKQSLLRTHPNNAIYCCHNTMRYEDWLQVFHLSEKTALLENLLKLSAYFKSIQYSSLTNRIVIDLIKDGRLAIGLFDELSLSLFTSNNGLMSHELLKAINWDLSLPTPSLDVLCVIYKIYDAKMAFPNYQSQHQLSEQLLKLLKNYTNTKSRVTHLLNLISDKGCAEGTPLTDRRFFKSLVKQLVTDFLNVYGIDDGSLRYFNAIKEMIDLLTSSCCQRDLLYVFGELTKAIQAQSMLCSRISKFLKKENNNIETGVTLTGIIEMAKYFSNHQQDRELILAFLTCPITYASLDHFARETFNKFERNPYGPNPFQQFFAPGQKPTLEDFRKNSQLFYYQFWDLEIEQRAVIINNVLVTARDVLDPAEHLKAFEQATAYVMGRLFPVTDLGQNDFARSFITSYLQCANSYEREFLLAGMITTSNELTLSGEEPSPSKKLALLCEHMGPAYIKLAQALHSHPDTPADVKADLSHLKGRANPPPRWELWDLLQRVLSVDLRKQIKHVGPLLGSASYNMALQTTMENDEQQVILLLREGAKVKAEKGFRHLSATIQHCNHPQLVAHRDNALAILAEAERSSLAEMDAATGDRQNQLATKAYSNQTLTVTADAQIFQVHFQAAQSNASGNGYRFLSLQKGIEFNDLPKHTARDKLLCRLVAKAVLIMEMRQILQGGYFDCDRHGNQLRVVTDRQTKTIHLGLYDFGEMSLQLPEQSALNALACVIRDLKAAMLAGQSFDQVFDKHIKLYINAPSAKNYLMRVRKAFLALQDFQKHLSLSELNEVIKAVAASSDIHPLLRPAVNSLVSQASFSGLAMGAYSFFSRAVGGMFKQEPKVKVFVSVANLCAADEVEGTGDIDYAQAITRQYTNSVPCELISQLHDENAIYRHVFAQTPANHTPILHLMLNLPRTGSAFTPAGLEQFQQRGGRLILTVIEFAKPNIVNLRSDFLAYMRVAETIIFLDEMDKNAAIKSIEPQELSLLDKTTAAKVIAVPATVPLIDTPVEQRGGNILSFGMIRQGKGFEHQLNLARLIKSSSDPVMNSKKLIIVGTVMNNKTLANGTRYDEQLCGLLKEIYPTKEDELSKKTPEELVRLHKQYLLSGIQPALPVELHVNVPEDRLADLFNRCKYAFLPAYRGGTLRNSSMSTCLSNGFITFSHLTEVTPSSLKEGGRYFGAMPLIKETSYRQYAETVFKDIKARECDLTLNQETLNQVDLLNIEVLSIQSVSQLHTQVLDELLDRVSAQGSWLSVFR